MSKPWWGECYFSGLQTLMSSLQKFIFDQSISLRTAFKLGNSLILEAGLNGKQQSHFPSKSMIWRFLLLFWFFPPKRLNDWDFGNFLISVGVQWKNKSMIPSSTEVLISLFNRGVREKRGHPYLFICTKISRKVQTHSHGTGESFKFEVFLRKIRAGKQNVNLNKNWYLNCLSFLRSLKTFLSLWECEQGFS